VISLAVFLHGRIRHRDCSARSGDVDQLKPSSNFGLVLGDVAADPTAGNTVARFAGRARRHLQCCGDARLLLVCTSASAARQGRVTELGEKIAQKICRPLRRSILESGR
jgi:hypothetical protein